MNISFRNVSMFIAMGSVLASCASKELLPPKPEAINFDQVMSDPSAEIKSTLKVDTVGKGLKDTKKFVVGAFQVRFRNSLTGELTVNDRNCKGTGMFVHGLERNDTLSQQVTENLYKEFTETMKKQGLEVVGLNEVKSSKELQDGVKSELSSGHLVELTAREVSNPFYEDSVMGRLPVGDLFGQQKKAQYLIYTPKEVPSYEYDLSKGEYDNFDVVVMPGVVPKHRIDAAAKIGAGVMTVGFEVELIKYDYDACDIRTEINITRAPMVRTRLTSFNAYPVGAEKSFSMFGYSVSDGLIMTPKSRGGTKGSGFIRTLFASKEYGTKWVEVDDGSVVAGESSVTPNPATFPAAFKKSTDVHVQMIKQVVTHSKDY